VIRRELLGAAQVPGGERLELYRHDRDFMIVLGRNELMSTRMRGSEEALATLTIERLAGRSAPHLLIGGYGMGFTLRMADVADVSGGAQGQYDAILLDVDNGPDGLVRPDNDRIYSRPGLQATRRALAPGGVLAVWSAAPDKAFTRRLRDARFSVEEVGVRARANGKGPQHTIWFGTKA
jgi:spermidine synthase